MAAKNGVWVTLGVLPGIYCGDALIVCILPLCFMFVVAVVCMFLLALLFDIAL